MNKRGLTRRQVLIGAAPVVAALPMAGMATLPALGGASRADAAGAAPVAHGHAAMIGAEAPAPGGPSDLDALLYPPPALPYQPGRVRRYALAALDREIEVAPGVFFPAWT
jgi:manganese oxidase